MCYRGAPVGGFTIQADGALLLFMDRGAVARWHPDDGSLTTVVREIPEEREARFNDVAADRAGGVFCGTVATAARPGRLYRLDPSGGLTVAVENVGISNDIGFTPARDAMCYADSAAQQISRFDFDPATGALTNRRLFAEVPPHEGLPDGLTVDAQGYVWSARWDRGCVVRYAPDGSEQRRIHFPARKVSSVTFGGPDYGDLYVTTAGGDKRAEEGAGAGALFRLRPGVMGVPEFPSRVAV